MGYGTGLDDLVSPDPGPEDAQMRQRHTARVQTPSGQTPRRRGTHSHVAHTGVTHTPEIEEDSSSMRGWVRVALMRVRPAEFESG